MRIKARDRRALLDFIHGDLSLRQTQKKLKVASMSMVYVRGFHLLKEIYEGIRKTAKE